MERIPGVRYLPLLVVAVVALTVALAGSAFGGTDAISAISSKTVKKIATKQINQLAPGLSVAKAKTADSATNAGSATSAGSAATADKVDGTDLCSGTLTLQNNDVKTVCQAGILDVEASCGISGASVDTQVTLQAGGSSTNDAWAFGETVDAASAVRLAEPFFGSGQATVAEGLDINNNPNTADGQGAWFSAGSVAGSSLSGNVSARANLTAPSQGECVVTLGVTAH